MSVVDFGQHAQAVASGIIGPLLHGELDGLLAPLSQDERRDVRDMLDQIVRLLGTHTRRAAGRKPSREGRWRYDGGA